MSRECEARGARVLTKVADVAARAELAAWISSVDAEAPLDLVVANAGVTSTTLGLDAPEQFEAGTRGIFDTNVTGVFNTVFPALEGMRRRGHGQVAIMSSVASMTSSNAGGLGAYAVRHRSCAPVLRSGKHKRCLPRFYSCPPPPPSVPLPPHLPIPAPPPNRPFLQASKVAVRFFGEGLRIMLAREGVRVSVVCPGFVESPMTDVVKADKPFQVRIRRRPHSPLCDAMPALPAGAGSDA